jgi:hypothetical protein
MKLRGFKALCWGLFLYAALAGCASTPKKVSHKKPPLTPAERLALKHYKMGIDAYANTRYSEAINDWKVTLANDPSNPNAAEYINRAERMLKATKDAKNSPAQVSPSAAQ